MNDTSYDLGINIFNCIRTTEKNKFRSKESESLRKINYVIARTNNVLLAVDVLPCL